MTGNEPLSLERLLARARAETGLDDLGDAYFLPPLRKLLESIDGCRDQLRPEAISWADAWVIRHLVNRLRMQRDIALHPEILAEDLLPPAAIIGLPRTGSTKLQRMLGAGGGFQEVTFWQAFNPAPFPESDPNAPDPRIDAAAAFVASLARNAPGSLKSHRVAVEAADEENHLLEQTFSTPATVSYMPVYDWCRYIERQDKTAMYQHLRKCLQYLQWQFHRGGSKPWLLKYPANLGNESYIARSFPDIRYIVTHRDPFRVLASLIRYVAETQMLNCTRADKRLISRWAIDEFASEMERHLAWREEMSGAAPILDIAYDEIVKDAFGVAARIHDFLGLPWTGETEARIRHWLADNDELRDKLEYSLDDVGFTEVECRKRFRDYYARFADFIGPASAGTRTTFVVAPIKPMPEPPTKSNAPVPDPFEVDRSEPISR
jgi:hypothetical protein